MTLICGGDPGQSGGVAIVRRAGGGLFEIVDAIPMPLSHAKKKPMLDGDELANFLDKYQPEIGVIEHVSSMKGQGVASSFQFGRMFGALENAMLTWCGRVDHVTPAVWKKAMALDSSKVKSTDLATQIFGKEAADEYWPKGPRGGNALEGVAEAALLAVWWIQRNDR